MVNVLGIGRVAALGAAALLVAACNKTPEPQPASNASTGAPAAAASGGGTGGAASPPAKAGDLAWDVPSAWTTVPNKSAMRRATYKIPAQPGDPDEVEMGVSRAGGSIDANIDRWKEQMKGSPAGFPKREDVKVGSLKVTIVENRGAYSAGNMMPGGAPDPGPKSGWAMLAAIVEVGQAPYFFKVTGPEKSVVAARADFDKLVGSIRQK